MKIYFTGSFHNDNVNLDTYKKIVSCLEKLGHTVKNYLETTSVRQLESQDTKTRVNYYDKLKKTISSVDIVVCEVSYPSTINIGHEVTLALDAGKPVLALHQPKREPGILQGLNSERFLLLEYIEEEIPQVLDYGISTLTKELDVRFTLLLPSHIVSHLNTIAKNGTTRSEYIRELIEKDMKKK